MAAWLIQTGTDSLDAATVAEFHLATDTATVAAAFRTLASYIAITPGVQDTWSDGDTATIHAADDRWLTLTASDDVPDSDLEAVMNALQPWIDEHGKD